eukprot:TRINITY_DN3073_c0_g1_i1.p2 TRINITY_DN3073_c0_g1~~TRINITY_DN3073_c0_g1_i1.p2  ORF type:complete len:309 (+),score=79.18 TRINITY_DN3073_c0_g1_i1:1156-2082(+)
MQDGIHKVKEGHVGVYYRGGALLPDITMPGVHVKIPWIDRFEDVQITIQTDQVTDIPCGTSGGVLLMIDKVEVVNRLKIEHVYQTIKNYTIKYDKIWIYDRIHHKINQFCSIHTLQEVYIDLFHTIDEYLIQELQGEFQAWAPGIEIIAIRMTKPTIPDAIKENYEKMEAEKTRLLIAVQTQKVVEKEAETNKKKAIIEAEKLAEVSKIQSERLIEERKSHRRMSEIEDETEIKRQKSLADAEFYQKKTEAEANKYRFTTEYLQSQLYKFVANNTKIYFGNSLKDLFNSGFQNSALLAQKFSNEIKKK